VIKIKVLDDLVDLIYELLGLEECFFIEVSVM